MANSQRKSLDLPDEERAVPNGKVEIWNLGDFVIGRATFNPGWRWSTDVKPIAGTEWCEYHHLGLMLEGEMHIATADGLGMELKVGHIYEVLPGHDAWVVGEGRVVQYDFAGMRTFALPAAGRAERVLSTLICTDIVDSTATAERIGPSVWTSKLAELNAASRHEIDRFRGRLAATTGDGVIAMFDGAERAIRCAAAISERAAAQGLDVRVGVHTGEVELLPDDIRGVAVHVLSRVTALGGAGEVLVSGTTHELVVDSDLRFEDRGQHELKGVTSARQIWVLLLDGSAAR
ncbi:MAG TPA: adenylate/guanylate cyclase domain-containing protein [Candidatus Limnocylindria bacterium]|jgi:class 3 adenylate cyclase|nr:adenylate/guanylate cyclase domain-containing protein [Candidatus Limnocylindria bacterium]